MSQLLSKLIKFFHGPTALETFVASKNPTNIAELEFWIKQYNTKKFGSLV